MPKTLPSIFVAVIIVVVILLMMCAFQVKYTETAVVTRFDHIKQVIKPADAGFQWKLPWPIETVHRYDARLRTLETEFKQLGTADQKTVVLTAYATWRIDDAEKFLKAIGREDAAEPKLRDLLENRVSEVLKSHALSDIVTTNADKMKFDEIEKSFLVGVQERALKNYGVEINSVGVKRLNIPESVTKEVFARMKEERQKTIKELEGQGTSEAQGITARAYEEASKIEKRAEAYGKKIENEGVAESMKFYPIFAENRELADFLKKRESILKILQSGEITLVLSADEIIPFDELLRRRTPPAPSGATLKPDRTDTNTNRNNEVIPVRKDDAAHSGGRE